MKRVTDISDELQFTVGATTLQSEMVSFFLTEVLKKTQNLADLDADTRSNTASLLGLAANSLVKVFAQLIELKGTLTRFQRSHEDLENTINGLQVIRQTGSIEAAILGKDRVHFDNHIRHMSDFIRKVNLPMKEAGGNLAGM